MKIVVSCLLLPCALTAISAFTSRAPINNNRRSITLFLPAAETTTESENVNDNDDESQRYHDQAERLREQIRQMEADLGPSRKRSYEYDEQPPTAADEQGEEDIEMTLRGKRILVAGANGQLGSMVCRYLLRNYPQTQVIAAVHYVGESSPTSRGYARLSYEVGAEDGTGTIAPAWTIDDRETTFEYNPEVMQGYNLQNLRLVECEYLDPLSCKTIVEDADCDAIVWCATDFNGNLPRAVSSLNVALLFRAVTRPAKGRVDVEGVENMLGALRQVQLDRKRVEQMADSGKKKSRGTDPINFVLVSADTGAFQDTETPFGTFYGIKKRGEDLIRDFPSVTSTVLRMARFDDNFVKEDLSVLLTDASDDDTASSVSTAFEGPQRFINRRDAARAVAEALTNEELLGKTVNVWTASR